MVHFICKSLFFAIIKRSVGSGLSELLVATGVIRSGSVDQAMKRKHFNRAICCRSLMWETLTHFLLKKQDFIIDDEEKRMLKQGKNTGSTQAVWWDQHNL